MDRCLSSNITNSRARKVMRYLLMTVRYDLELSVTDLHPVLRSGGGGADDRLRFPGKG